MPNNSAMDRLRRKQAAVGERARLAPPHIEDELARSQLEDVEQYEDELDVSAQMAERRTRRTQARHIRLVRCVETFLVLLCVYLVFLIYGVINTDFVYDDAGRVVPLGLSIGQIQALEEFNALAVQYRQARLLYEQVLVLDYRVAAGIEEPLLVAPEYEVLLASVEPLAIQLSAMDVAPEYTQTKNMLLAWTQTDLAVYLQSMSKAISQNNVDSANQALEYRGLMYSDYSIITQNIVTLGTLVDGAELEDILKWSPEQYVQATLGVYYS